MTVLVREIARAKVNLTLEILGRRPDGYHELASLVVFADVGDVVSLNADKPIAVTMSGPFADGVKGDNIVSTTLDRLARQLPELKLGAVNIEKQLPVAAGLGGGSANAAAVLRAILRLNPEHHQNLDWYTFAESLGADVPVCLANTAKWMTGVGVVLTDVPQCEALPLHAVLVNPMSEVPPDKTAQVFQVLAARPLGDNLRPRVSPEDYNLGTFEDVVAFAGRGGNDLERPAAQTVPAIVDVLDVLRAVEGCGFAAMSGAGPTCFGLFATQGAAQRAASHVALNQPDWWVCPTVLRS
ncbi:MAG: 4-(cytidine 5'-diphospho)-2-C-methyl-D-erythritol kinase [Pseudomonadota bacterium]